jgi:hypothetical protein
MTDELMDHVPEHLSPPANLARHFEGRAANVRLIYDSVVAAARKFGPVEEDPKKTSIHLNRRSAFAGIQTRGDTLILTVKSTGDIADPRISKREQASANRWHHEIRIYDPAEIDDQIIMWLEHSYQLSG